jgi:hypothetical protein
MANCIGWLFDVSIEHDQAVIWIKTSDKKVLKLTDSYHPSFYILYRSETDGLYLFQILSRQLDIVEQVRWEESKLTDELFDYDCTYKRKKLIYVQIQSTRYYQPLLKKIGEDSKVKQLFNADLSHIQRYLFTQLRIEPTSMVKVEYSGSKILQITKIDDDEEQEVSQSPPQFSLLYFDLHTFSGILASDDGIRLIKVRYESYEKKEREEDIFFQIVKKRQSFKSSPITFMTKILTLLSAWEIMVIILYCITSFSEQRRLGLTCNLEER